MSRAIRTVLVWLLAMALPLQGAMAAGMMACAPQAKASEVQAPGGQHRAAVWQQAHDRLVPRPHAQQPPAHQHPQALQHVQAQQHPHAGHSRSQRPQLVHAQHPVAQHHPAPVAHADTSADPLDAPAAVDDPASCSVCATCSTGTALPSTVHATEAGGIAPFERMPLAVSWEGHVPPGPERPPRRSSF